MQILIKIWESNLSFSFKNTISEGTNLRRSKECTEMNNFFYWRKLMNFTMSLS